MKTVSYQEYARELEMAKKRLEEKTCVQEAAVIAEQFKYNGYAVE